MKFLLLVRKVLGKLTDVLTWGRSKGLWKDKGRPGVPDDSPQRYDRRSPPW